MIFFHVPTKDNKELVLKKITKFNLVDAVSNGDFSQSTFREVNHDIASFRISFKVLKLAYLFNVSSPLRFVDSMKMVFPLSEASFLLILRPREAGP